MPVFSNNGTLQVREDRPSQYGTRVLPIPKGQVGQVRVVAHLHPRVPPRGGGFSFLGGGATATAAAISTSTAGPGDETRFPRAVGTIGLMY